MISLFAWYSSQRCTLVGEKPCHSSRFLRLAAPNVKVNAKVASFLRKSRVREEGLGSEWLQESPEECRHEVNLPRLTDGPLETLIYNIYTYAERNIPALGHLSYSFWKPFLFLTNEEMAH